MTCLKKMDPVASGRDLGRGAVIHRHCCDGLGSHRTVFGDSPAFVIPEYRIASSWEFPAFPVLGLLRPLFHPSSSWRSWEPIGPFAPSPLPSG